MKHLLPCAGMALCLGLLGLLPCLPAWAEARPVSVGVYANEPKLLLDAKGRPSGILGELLNAIAERENWRLRPVSCQ
jgi:hypothetical protein